MEYCDANNMLTGRCKQSRKVGNNTYLERRGESIAVKLHTTDVLTFDPDGTVTLNTGGWSTVTTKARFNEYLPSGWRVYSDRGVWYLYGPRDEKYPYADGVAISPDGTVTGAGSDPRETIKRRNRIKRYSARFVDKLYQGKIPSPSGGDCSGCLFRPAGDTSDTHVLGKDHIWAHVEESYYVPSLLYRAAETMEMSMAARETIQSLTNGGPESPYGGIVKDQIRKGLTRYIYRCCGLAA